MQDAQLVWGRSHPKLRVTLQRPNLFQPSKTEGIVHCGAFCEKPRSRMDGLDLLLFAQQQRQPSVITSEHPVAPIAAPAATPIMGRPAVAALAPSSAANATTPDSTMSSAAEGSKAQRVARAPWTDGEDALLQTLVTELCARRGIEHTRGSMSACNLQTLTYTPKTRPARTLCR